MTAVLEDQMARACMDAPIGVQWIAPDGAVLWTNRVASELLQGDGGSTVRRSIFGCDVTDNVAMLVRRIRCGERSGSTTAELSYGSGVTKQVAVEAHGEWSEGTLSAVRCFIRDITDDRNAARAVARADKAALDVVRLKSEFLSNISHELRTPLSGILGFTDLALVTELDDEQREYVDRIRECGRGLLALIEDLLDLSSLDAGNLDVEPAPLDLRALIESVTRPFAIGAEEKGLDLVCDIRPEVPRRAVGADCLRRILSHLLDNAIKFTERGEIVVRASVAARGAGGASTLHLAISDSGIGIPDEQQRAIIERFAQGDGSSTRRYGGLGIGLAIAHELVTVLGGRLWVESRVGEGSTFHVTVTMQPADYGFSPLACRTVFSGRSALALVPHESGRRILTETLTRYGITAQCVSDDRDALAALETRAASAHPFDLAVIDDRARGAAPLLERLRETTRQYALPLLLLTAPRASADATAPLGDGSIALPRPVTEDALAQPLATLLGRSVVSRAVAGAHAERCRRSALRVLVAEDDAGSRMIATRSLERRGHTVRAVANGKEALKALARDRFDVVLMDVQMPEMDGLSAASAIRRRADERVRHLPIVALTAPTKRGDRERCLDAGMDAYLTKPVNTAQLVTTIESVARAS